MKLISSLRMPLLAGLVALGMGSTAAQAVPIYTENFSSWTTSGIPLNTAGEAYSERFAIMNVYTIGSSPAAWSTSGSTYLAVSGTGDKALNLNEPTGNAVLTLTGLVAGGAYTIEFNLSGDNRPNVAYIFNLDINAVNVLNVTDQWTGVVGVGGSGTGTTRLVNFFADAGGLAVFRFYESSTALSGESSPIIDNISVYAVPEPATLGLFGMGLLGVAALRRRRKKAADCAIA